MAFLFGALLGLVLGVGVVMAFARLENSRAEQRRELAATVSSFSKLSVQDLKTLIPTESYPSWVSFTQKQKLKWLNQELVKIWPFINEAASELIKSSVEPVFEQYKSFILASIHFSKLTLGTVAPQFTVGKLNFVIRMASLKRTLLCGVHVGGQVCQWCPL